MESLAARGARRRHRRQRHRARSAQHPHARRGDRRRTRARRRRVLRPRRRAAGIGRHAARARREPCRLPGVGARATAITGRLISAVWDPWADAGRASDELADTRRLHAAPHRARVTAGSISVMAEDPPGAPPPRVRCAPVASGCRGCALRALGRRRRPRQPGRDDTARRGIRRRCRRSRSSCRICSVWRPTSRSTGSGCSRPTTRTTSISTVQGARYSAAARRRSTV